MDRRTKFLGALILIIAAVGWSIMTVRSNSPNAGVNNGYTGAQWGRGGRPNFDSGDGERRGPPPEIRERMRAMAESGNFEDMQKMREEMMKQMPPEAMERMQVRRTEMQQRRAERENKMKAVLGKDQFEEMQASRRGRGRGGFGGRGGWGGGRGGGGPR